MPFLDQSFPAGLAMLSSFRVQGAGDVQHPRSSLGHVEDALDYRGRVQIRFQFGPLLRPVLHHDPFVAVGRPAANPEAAGGGLAHPSRDLLGQILAVEFVHALDDGLHELAGGGVVSVLGDGDHEDALASEHGLEGDGVLALSGETGELPDQDFLEGGVGPAGLVDHLAELRPVGDASALRLVHILTGDHVAVLPCVSP